MRRRVAVVFFGIISLLSAFGPGTRDASALEIHTRYIEVYYGTQTIITGGASATRDLLFLTDHITDYLSQQIAYLYPDARVANHIGNWVDNSVTDIEWVLGTPEGLPAADNLLRELSNVGGRCLVECNIGPQIDHGSQSYLLQTWATFETSPGAIVVGDPDSGGGFSSTGTLTIVEHEGYANVHYYERNATVLARAAVPVPGTLSLFAAGLAGVGVIAQRKRRRG